MAASAAPNSNNSKTGQQPYNPETEKKTLPVKKVNLKTFP